MATEPAVRISRRILDRYLLDEESPVVATRRHWVTLIEPVATALVTLFLTSSISTSLERGDSPGAGLVWYLWFAVLGRAIWKLVEWHNEWFVATDRRMLMVYGLVTHKVAMMPLAKVTDMNYGRSLLGRLLGYGHFVLESAGQEQAMREIRWMPDPDEKYRRICAIIFKGTAGMGMPGVRAPWALGGDGQGRVDKAFEEGVEQDPFEANFHDTADSFADRFDPDLVRIEPHSTGRGRAAPGGDEPRRERWEPVERDELPDDWDWVDDDRGGRGGRGGGDERRRDDRRRDEREERAHRGERYERGERGRGGATPARPRGRRPVAVDPDPTPWR